MYKRIISSTLFFIFILLDDVMAHCPLCTAGAAIAAGGALWLGVDVIVVGLFIGAFAVSLGIWISNMIKKNYIPYQKSAITLFSFIFTIVPIIPIVSNVTPLYISIAGDYGSLFNRVYLINSLLLGSFIGAFIVSIAPWLSKSITKYRKGRIIPFQGTILTLILLIIIGVIIQFIR